MSNEKTFLNNYSLIDYYSLFIGQEFLTGSAPVYEDDYSLDNVLPSIGKLHEL